MMKTGIQLLFLLLLTTSVSSQDNPFKVGTFNIRLDTPRDSINQWSNRKQWVWQTISYFEMDIVGMQEVMHHQLQYLLEQDKRYKHIGVGRDDGKQAGEYSPILYNTQRFECLDSNTFWLSENPEKPGLGWDASYNRVVTWGKFQDIITKNIFFVFNTHFDHIAETARRESARLVHQQIVKIAGLYPIVLMGDFNAPLDSEPMQIILAKNQKRPLRNTFEKSKTPHFGPTGTFNGFESKETSNAAIDHILVTEKIQVKNHATLSESWNGRFASDHFAVISTLYFLN